MTSVAKWVSIGSLSISFAALLAAIYFKSYRQEENVKLSIIMVALTIFVAVIAWAVDKGSDATINDYLVVVICILAVILAIRSFNNEEGIFWPTIPVIIAFLSGVNLIMGSYLNKDV